MMRSGIAVIIAAFFGSLVSAQDEQIETYEDFAVCQGLFLAMKHLEPLSSIKQSRVSDETITISGDFDIKRLQAQSEKLGEANGVIDALNAIVTYQKDRGCENSYTVEMLENVCARLRTFSDEDKQLLGCPS